MRSAIAMTMAALAAMILTASAAMAALAPEQRCEAGKNDAAGKYAACMAKAEKAFVLNGDPDKYATSATKCETRLIAIWTRLETAAAAAGTTCPSTSDRSPVEGFVDACVQSVAVAVAGGTLGPDPITCNTELATCGEERTTAQSGLSACADSLDICTANLSGCNAEVTTCQTDLAYCQATPAQPLQTGQTQCMQGAPWAMNGTLGPCPGTVAGQDGQLRRGRARGYRDNNDGTITDTATGLMWEKLSNDGSIHDVVSRYQWENAIREKIPALNAGAGFAGYTDWRLPNINELLTLVDWGRSNFAIDPAFNTGCTLGCTVVSCSCTANYYYWSSTWLQGAPSYAWTVEFQYGFPTYTGPYSDWCSARAVRGGS